MQLRLLLVMCLGVLFSGCAGPTPPERQQPTAAQQQAPMPKKTLQETLAELGVPVIREVVDSPMFRLSVENNSTGPFIHSKMPTLKCERMRETGTTNIILGSALTYSNVSHRMLTDAVVFNLNPIGVLPEKGSKVEISISAPSPPNGTFTGEGIVRYAVFELGRSPHPAGAQLSNPISVPIRY